MTLNAEFLWDGIAPEEGSADFPWKDSQTEAEEHMRAVADLIIRANPDVINLVEVENLQSITRLNDLFLAGRGYRPFFAQGADTSTGQDVALLTRIDPDGNAIRYDNRMGQSGSVNKRVSKDYVADLTIGTTRISLIGLHFLAFPLQETRRLQRQAQADAIRAMARERAAAGAEVVVLGDFNDYDETTLDHIDSLPISTVLRDIRGMDPGNATDDLRSAAELVAKASRFTAFHDANDNGQANPPNEFTSIDHVLLSQNLFQLVESVDIPHDHNPIDHPDHFPIVVRIRLTGVVPPTGGRMRMTSLLPNPSGDENQNETITLSNLGNQSVTLTGWTVRDVAGKTWHLDSLGVVNAGQVKTIQRLGQPMAMNNTGDTIDLLDQLGSVVQSVTFGATQEGDVVTPAIPPQ